MQQEAHSISENREILIFADLQELSRVAATRFVHAASDTIAQNGRFTVALAGGSTPKSLYSLLASDEFRNQVDWSKVYFFFGDERAVPPDHIDSNFRMASESLLNHIPIQKSQIFRMKGENSDVEAAADEYGQQLQQFFGLQSGTGPSPENFPRFDLILLGMGPDGHTASLFPGTKALQERGKPVTGNWVEKLNTNRITLTAPSLNRAVQVWFLVAGEDKAEPLHEVLEGQYQPETYPSQLIQPQNGKVIFMVDKKAASKLSDKLTTQS